MEYLYDYSNQFIKELEALPREYTMTMAKRNRDVIYQMLLNFNIGRFLIFMDNYNNGIPDKIRITKFGVDGPPSIAILFYDGNLITYVIDETRYQTNTFFTFYGYEIIVNKSYLDNRDIMIGYSLITLDQKQHSILGIWAGYPSDEII